MTVKQFKTYIKRGLGRAVTALYECDDREKFRAAVLWACLNDYSYDTQSEGTRAQYTYELAAAFHDDGYFVGRVARKFLYARIPYGWVFQHLCDVLTEFVARGNEAARAALEQKYAELYNKMLTNRPRSGEVDIVLEYYEHITVGLGKLFGAARFDKLDGDITEIIARNGNYDRTDFDWFCLERDNNGKKETPSACGMLIERASSCVDIGELLARAEKYADYSDEADEWHATALDILDAADSGRELPPELLKFVYESPCASCRNSAVRALYRCGRLTSELLSECLHDSNTDTRAFAEKVANSESRP